MLLLLLASANGFAQRGRSYISIEAHIGLSKFVHVGAIESLEQVAYDKPLPFPLNAGKEYRLLFKVAETIRGARVSTVELLVNLQHNTDLEYLRDHHTELMLIGGSSLDDEGEVIVLEEQGQPVDPTRDSFRILRPLPRAKGKDGRTVGEQININLDSGSMFDVNLSVVRSRDEILKRARAFAKNHSEVLKTIWLLVPREFGEQCGYANAYCGIRLPVCAETEHTLTGLLKNPNRLLKGVKPNDRDYARSRLLADVLGALELFPSKENASLVRKIVENYQSKSLQNGRIAAPDDVKRAADRLLERWKL